jgi:hypothetical protein
MTQFEKKALERFITNIGKTEAHFLSLWWSSLLWLRRLLVNRDISIYNHFLNPKVY